MTKDKQKIEEIKNQLIGLTNDFCLKHVNKEYAELCKKLIQKMSRRRVVPYLSGRIEIWAAACIHAIGSINFLFDKNTNPYVSAEFIREYFGVPKSTVGQKAKLILDMFNINNFDPDFSTQDMIRENPFNNLAMVNGFIVRLEE